MQSDRAHALRGRGRAVAYMRAASNRDALAAPWSVLGQVTNKSLTLMAINNSKSPRVISSAMCSGFKASISFATRRSSCSSVSDNVATTGAVDEGRRTTVELGWRLTEGDESTTVVVLIMTVSGELVGDISELFGRLSGSRSVSESECSVKSVVGFAQSLASSTRSCNVSTFCWSSTSEG